jgi:drug/metabolite transporter (DMT)-like permease
MLPILFAVLAGLCWGVGEVLTKQVLASKQVGVLTVVCLRILGETPFAILLYLAVHKVFSVAGEPAKWWTAPTPILLKLFIGTSLLSGFFGVAFYYFGLKFGQVSVVKPIAFTVAPAVGAILATVLLKEAMPVQKIIGIALILTGVAVLATTKSPHAPPPASPAAARLEVAIGGAR